MKSLLTQCAVAAFAAAVASASVSMAQDSRPGIGAQIEALGLDRAEVRARLDGLSRDERIAYLQSLGVQLPAIAARPATTLTPGSSLPGPSLKVNPDAAKGTASVTPLPAPAHGRFTTLPFPLPAGDKGAANGTLRPVQLPVVPGSVSGSGTVVSDRPAVGTGAGTTAPGAPAKP